MKGFLPAPGAAGLLLCFYGLLCLPTAARTTGAEASEGVPTAAARHRLERRESGLIPYLLQQLPQQWDERKIQISRFLTGRHQSEIAVYPVVQLPLRDTMPISYRVPVKIGPERFQLLMDTGSSVTWVPGGVGRVADPLQVAFDPSSASSTFKRAGRAFEVGYGLGETGEKIAGYTGTALVSVGQSTVRATIGIVTKSNKVFDGLFAPATVGMLGMDRGDGDGAHGPIRCPSIMRTLVSSAKKQPLFTVSLPLGRYSHINLGQIDRSRYAGDLIQTKTHPEELDAWAVKAFAVSVGNRRGQEPAVSIDTSEKMSVFDTDSREMVLPEPVVRAYMSQVPGGAFSSDPVDHEIYVRCDAKLPDLHLHLHPASGSRSGSGTGRSGIATVPGAMLLGDRVLLEPPT